MEDISAFLAKTVLFSVLPHAALPAIAQVATRVALAKGEALFTAGTAGDAVYLVRSGLLQVGRARPSSGVIRSARSPAASTSARWRSWTGEPRAAGAIAVVESRCCACAPRRPRRTLFQAHPQLWARLSLGLCEICRISGGARAAFARAPSSAPARVWHAR
jgi:CRP-like cAMP-binding protein